MIGATALAGTNATAVYDAATAVVCGLLCTVRVPGTGISQLDATSGFAAI